MEMEIVAVTKFQVVGDCFPERAEDKENIGVVSPRSRCCKKRKRKPLQDITRLMSDTRSVNVIRPPLSSVGVQPLSCIPSQPGNKKRKATDEGALGHKRPSLRKSFR